MVWVNTRLNLRFLRDVASPLPLCFTVEI